MIICFLGHSYMYMLKTIHTVQTCELLCNILFKWDVDNLILILCTYIVEYENIMYIKVQYVLRLYGRQK